MRALRVTLCVGEMQGCADMDICLCPATRTCMPTRMNHFHVASAWRRQMSGQQERSKGEMSSNHQ